MPCLAHNRNAACLCNNINSIPCESWIVNNLVKISVPCCADIGAVFPYCFGCCIAVFRQQRVWHSVWKISIRFVVDFYERERQILFKEVYYSPCTAVPCILPLLCMVDRLCEKSVFQKCYLTKSIDYNSQISKKRGFHTACRPEDLGLPFTRWSVSKLASYCKQRGILPDITDEWVRRLLRREGLTPQRTKTWKESPDTEFEVKKTEFLTSTHRPQKMVR